MNQLLNDFSANIIVIKGQSALTASNYVSDLKQFFNLCDITEPNQITESRILDYMVKIKDLEATSRRRKLSAIRKFSEYLIGKNLLQNNESLKVPFPKADKKIPNVMSVSQTLEILDSASRTKDIAILETLYGTGCRVAELVRIKISDIDFETNHIKLFGKGAKERLAKTSQTSINAIRQYIETRGVNSLYVFEGRDPNRPMTTKGIYKRVKELTDKKVNPHMFRHSFATHILSRGGNIKHISKMLGHTSVATTEIYTHVVLDEVDATHHMYHPRG